MNFKELKKLTKGAYSGSKSAKFNIAILTKSPEIVLTYDQVRYEDPEEVTSYWRENPNDDAYKASDGYFYFNATAQQVSADTPFTWTVTTIDNTGASQANILSVTILNDSIPPNITSIIPNDYSFVKNDLGIFGVGGGDTGIYTIKDSDIFNLLKKGNEKVKLAESERCSFSAGMTPIA